MHRSALNNSASPPFVQVQAFAGGERKNYFVKMMSGWEIIGLAGSAAGAGAVNAVAGGGTLLTFPTLLAFGVSPVTANATSTLASRLALFAAHPAGASAANHHSDRFHHLQRDVL